MKKLFKGILIAVLAVIGVVVLFFAFLAITEYRPEAAEPVEWTAAEPGLELDPEVKQGDKLTLMTFNIGYAGLSKEADFFMDGGSGVYAQSRDRVEANLAGIVSTIKKYGADAVLLQETDINSTRTYGVNEREYISNATGLDSTFAHNYKCEWVPYPWPMMGRVESGVTTLSRMVQNSVSERIALPVPFKWPVSMANIKRCLLVTRVDMGDGTELVLINLHLEAYDSGEGKRAQTEQLMGLLEEEYEAGNYVIAGGDFNQAFEGVMDMFPIKDENMWTPGIIESEMLPEGFSFVTGEDATCRLLDKPFTGRDSAQLYVIDGFLISPNVELVSARTVDMDFEYSDHQPVLIDVILK